MGITGIIYKDEFPKSLFTFQTLSQGHSFQQYDCDGKTAVTITLDKGVTTEEGKLVKKLQYGVPNGHLTAYTNIGRL